MSSRSEHGASDRRRRPARTRRVAWTSRLGDRISGFLAQVRPYRELIGLIVALVAVVSGSVSWAVSQFATQAQLKNLGCETAARFDNSSTFTKELVLQADQTADHRNLDELIHAGLKTPTQITKASELSEALDNDAQQLAALQVADSTKGAKCK